MNKKSLLKTALVSAAILSGAGLFANAAQAQAATPAVHAEQVRGVLKVVDHEHNGRVHLYDREGHVMKQTVKNGKKYKVWEKAYINDELMYRIGTDKQWIPAKYTDWKDAKLGQNVAVTSKATNVAYNRENYVGVATVNYQGSGNVRLVNSQGNYTSQYLPKNSNWKVWEKADINHEPMYRVGNQSQWVPAKYITVSQTNTENSQNSGVHTSAVGNNTNKPTSVATHESTQRPVDNSTHSSKGLPQGNVSAGNSSSTSNSSHNTANTTPETPVTPVKPATSSKPADTKPTEPAKPAVPTKPVDTKPVQPVTPTEPAKPAKPEVPATPAKPVAPATPVKPAEPAKPVTPTQPTKPAKPTTPTDNSNQALTTSQMDQVFWNGYMAPNGYQRGTMTREEYDNYTGSSTSSYMTLHNYHYVNTDASKKEFLQDTKETADQYEWNDRHDADGNKFQKASLQVTQTSPDDIRIDAIWYN